MQLSVKEVENKLTEFTNKELIEAVHGFGMVNHKIINELCERLKKSDELNMREDKPNG